MSSIVSYLVREREEGLRSLSMLGMTMARYLVGKNETLMSPFSLVEVEEALKASKTNTAPGPDGFPVKFYKQFWPILKEHVFLLVNAFTRGLVDIKRLNYGVLMLLPKVLGADSIKQFRPITLINVIFKLIVKGFAIRLSPVEHHIIHSNRTAFIRGRCFGWDCGPTRDCSQYQS